MKKGIYYSLLAALISGISIFYNKIVIVKDLDPVIFNIFKNGGAALILSIFLFSQPAQKNFHSLTLSNWKKIILIGLIGGSLPFLLFFEGLKIIPAINANLIQKSLFIWVAFLALPILQEKLNIWQITGYLLVIAGNFLIGNLSPLSLGNGELLILLATLLWSVEIIVSKKLLNDHLNSHLVSWGRMFFGTIFLLLFALFQNKLGLIFSLKSEQILPMLGSIILLTIYVRTFYKALNHAPATLVTSILILATPITNLLNSLFISHTFPVLQMNNLILSIFGIIMISFFLKKNPQKTVTTS
jgi:drug/metabolite transporter (DMT)-like permease